MFKLFCLKNNYHSLLNLGKNNLKLIYPKNTQIFDYKLVLNLASYKNLTLISTLYNAKMLRPSEIKKIFETSYLKNILHLIQLFYFKHISIENILTINFSGYGIQLNAGFSTTIINHAPGRLRNAKVFLYPNIKTFF